MCVRGVLVYPVKVIVCVSVRVLGMSQPCVIQSDQIVSKTFTLMSVLFM